MSNDEGMTKIPMSKKIDFAPLSFDCSDFFRHSLATPKCYEGELFGFHSSFVIRHSSFSS
jgi:hypothetical protein